MSSWQRRLCALGIAFSLVGCGGAGETPAPVNAPEKASGTVSLLVFGDPEELQAYRNLITEFKQVQPEVTVKLVEASDREDLLARLATAFSGGTPPDLFLLNYRYYAQFAAKGVLEPVQDLVESSQKFEQTDFYPQALEAFRYHGKLTCMPQNISSLVVYYNKDLFAKAGVDPPKSGWTWADMVDAARKLTKGDVHGLGVDPEVIRVAPFVWSAGGELVDDVQRPTEFTLLNDGGTTALREFFALHSEHKVVPGDDEVAAEDNETRFENGRLAMVMSSRRSTPSFRQITKFDWDIAGLPQHEQPASVLHSDAYCLTKASKNKGAAWRFLEFAVSQDGQQITAATGRTVPSHIATSTSEAFLDPDAKPASSRVFLDSIPSIRQLPAVSTWPEIEDKANKIIEAGFYGKLPAEQVAARLIEETRPIFGRAR